MANKKKPVSKSKKITATRSKKPAVQKSSAQPKAKVKLKRNPAQLPNAGRILVESLTNLKKHWQFVIGFTAVYGLMNIILVHSLSINPDAIHKQATQLGGSAPLGRGFGTYAALLTSGSAHSGVNGVYQYLVLILASLAFIWGLRQFMSDSPPAKLRIRDTYYEGMYPLVPFVLVLLVIVLELLPFIIAAGIYALVFSSGIAVNAFQQALWLTLLAVGICLSGWLVLRSLFGLYIVTLPQMTPGPALKKSKEIVYGLKLNILRKILFLMVALVVIGAILIVPAVLIYTPLAKFALVLFTITCLPIFHGYMYTLYRKII